MQTTSLLDVLIIGGGPIGLACGIEAQRRGLSYLIVEKGCLVNSLYNYPVNMTFFSTSERLEIGDVPFISHNPKPTRSEALEYYRRVQSSWNLNVNLYERVKEVKQNDTGLVYQIETNKAIYQSLAVVVATGFYDKPHLIGVPGENLPHVKHYYDDPHLYARQKIVVVGAQNSAVDVALETYRKGAEVTMVIKSEGIGERVKYWVRPDILNRIEEGTIKAHFQSKIVAIRPQETEIETPKGNKIIPTDFVLAMTGYQPDFELLESIGLKLSEDGLCKPAYDPSTMETNLDNVFLAGVVCGGMETSKWFIENSREHAEIIMELLAERLQTEAATL